MKYNPDGHHRRSIRLKGYDYSQPGAYFITICTQNRACLFGEVVGGEMALNDAGRMIEKWYFQLENKFPDILCDEYVVMPNHFHAIIINVGADRRVCPDSDRRVCPDKNEYTKNTGQSHTTGQSITTGHSITTGQSHRIAPTGSSLNRIVQWFKTMTTNEYILGVKQNGWEPFPGKFWQRNYWERIIRDKNELNRIRQYIINNPFNWQTDENYNH